MDIKSVGMKRWLWMVCILAVNSKKRGSKFLNLTFSRTFAFPKKTVIQCDRCDCSA